MRKLWIIGVALLTSCAPIYIPNSRNVPLFDGKGEAQIGGFLTSAGADAQAAVSLTDHLAIAGSYSYGSHKRTNPDFSRRNTFAEGAIGYYSASRKSRFELFIGYGVGKGTNLAQYYFFADDFGQGDTIVTAKMSRFMIQPTFSTNNRKFDIAFTPRLSWVNYSEFTAGDVTETPSEKAQLFIEPAITGKFHLKGNIFGLFQLGLAQALPNEAFFDHQPLQVSFGFLIDTGGLGTKVYKR